MADGYVCSSCVESHAQNLGDLPCLASEAVVTLTRQDKIVRRVGGRSAEHPLFFSWRASVALDTLTSTLDAWINEIEQGVELPNSPLARVGFLLDHLAWVSANPLGPQVVDEINYVTDMLRRTIDLPTTRWFAGFCDQCREPLYGEWDSAVILCDCGTRYDAEVRREWLRAQVNDSLLPLGTIWAALGTLAGSRPPWGVVRRWPTRVRDPLAIRGVSLAGEELFLVSDVLERVAGYQARRRRRTLELVS